MPRDFCEPFVTVDIATSFLGTGHKGSFEMRSLAGFIHARENAKVLRRISDPARISKSENRDQNPGIRRSSGAKEKPPDAVHERL
jgi:hypothetical protein